MDSLKEKYEEFHKNSGIQRRIVNSSDFTYHIVLSFIDRYLRPEMRVLDIGCGVGVISLYIASKGNEVLGVDISEKAIDAAAKSAGMLGMRNASFKAANFLDAGFKEKFDFIIFSEVLEHLVDDRLALEKVYGLLSPSGILEIDVPSKGAPLHKLRKLIYKKDLFDLSVGHLRRYDYDKFILMLKSQGFQVLEAKRIEGLLRNFLFTSRIGNRALFLARPKFMKALLIWLDTILLHLSGAAGFIVIAKRPG